MTDDLATWLTQILDEDEERVRAAIADDGGQDGGFEDSFDQLTGGEERGGPLAFVPRFGEAAAAMIVWQTPRRALARIAADRQILALGICPACDVEDQPCDHRESTLRLLASVHADRPGYREEWRP